MIICFLVYFCLLWLSEPFQTPVSVSVGVFYANNRIWCQKILGVNPKRVSGWMNLLSKTFLRNEIACCLQKSPCELDVRLEWGWTQGETPNNFVFCSLGGGIWKANRRRHLGRHLGRDKWGETLEEKLLGGLWEDLGSLGIALGHLGSLGIIWEHLSGIIWDHLGSSVVICDHLASSGITWDHLGSSWIIQAYLGSSAGSIWEHLASSWIIWDQLGSSGIISYHLMVLTTPRKRVASGYFTKQSPYGGRFGLAIKSTGCE